MLILFGTAALLIFLFSLDLGWSNLLTSQRNDLVFENRNHEYGAYALRREHHMNLFYAMLISVGVVTGGVMTLSMMAEQAPLESVGDLIKTICVTVDLPQDKIEQEQDPAPKRAVAATLARPDSEVQVVEEPVEEIPDLTIPPSSGPSDPDAEIGEPSQGPVGSGGNGTSPAANAPEMPEIRDFAATMPQFPGGELEMQKYVQSHVDYDDVSRERGVEGIVYVSFVVMPDGSVAHVEIIRGIINGKRLSESVLETVKAMPRWKPGLQNGHPVAVRRTIPVNFKLKNS